MVTPGPPNWLWVPVVGIRWTTVLMAVAILLLVGGLRRRPFLAVVTTVAWASAYEIVFRAFDLAAHHLDGSLPVELQAWLWQAVATVSWPLLAHVLGVRPYWPLVVVCGLAFAVWLWGGFWYDWRGQPYGLLLGDEILNVVTKTGLGVAYLVGAFRIPPKLL